MGRKLGKGMLFGVFGVLRKDEINKLKYSPRTTTYEILATLPRYHMDQTNDDLDWLPFHPKGPFKIPACVLERRERISPFV